MPATYSQAAAREAYLHTVDELVARLGVKAAVHFMRQTTSAVEEAPKPVTSSQTRNLTIRERSNVFAAALEAAQL